MKYLHAQTHTVCGYSSTDCSPWAQTHTHMGTCIGEQAVTAARLSHCLLAEENRRWVGGFANNHCSVIATILTKATSCSDSYIYYCCLIMWVRKITHPQRSWCLAFDNYRDILWICVHACLTSTTTHHSCSHHCVIVSAEKPRSERRKVLEGISVYPPNNSAYCDKRYSRYVWSVLHPVRYQIKAVYCHF